MKSHSSTSGPSSSTLPGKKKIIKDKIGENISKIRNNSDTPKRTWYKPMDENPSLQMICLKLGNVYIYRSKKDQTSEKPWFGEFKSNDDVIAAFEACKEIIDKGDLDNQIIEAMGRAKRKK